MTTDQALEQVLEDRARALAMLPSREEDAQDRVEMLVFSLGSDRYGITADRVALIAPAPAVAWVPGAPPDWDGAAAVQGDIYPVLHLGRRLGLSDDRWSPTTIVIVDASTPLGLLCSDVPYLYPVARNSIGPALKDQPPAAGLLHGAHGEPVTVLDVDALVSEKDARREGG